MNGTKELPSLKHLRPPYPEYRDRFFTDENNATLKVSDPRHGFRHDARGFSWNNAWWLAEASGLVYDNFEAVRRRFEAAGLPLVREFDTKGKADTQCYVAANEDLVIVAFRGTESDNRADEEKDFEHIFNDFQTDANAKQTLFGAGVGQVHAGFSAALDAVWPELSAHLAALSDGRRTFWFTGHSLGAALATLAFARSANDDALAGFTAHGLYTFGSPLVGDTAFKTHFDNVLRKFGVEYYRFVNNQDLVPLVPPEKLLTLVPPKLFHYGHVGTLKFIDRDGQISGGLGGRDRLANFFGSLLKRAAGLFSKDTPARVRFVPGRLKDHVPMHYSTHIWNAHVKEQ